MKDRKNPVGQIELTFVTGNRNKYIEAQKIAQQYEVNLQSKALDIIEIQSNDPMEVAQAKARAAYQILHSPVVVHDSSWAIPALKGFPGAYMHDMVSWFEPEDWLNLMSGHRERKVEVYENVVYCDKQVEKCFQYRQTGIFTDVPRGINGNSIEKVVILADNKTIAEKHDTGGPASNSVILQVWENFFQWYQEKLKDAPKSAS